MPARSLFLKYYQASCGEDAYVPASCPWWIYGRAKADRASDTACARSLYFQLCFAYLIEHHGRHGLLNMLSHMSLIVMVMFSSAICQPDDESARLFLMPSAMSSICRVAGRLADCVIKW